MPVLFPMGELERAPTLELSELVAGTWPVGLWKIRQCLLVILLGGRAAAPWNHYCAPGLYLHGAADVRDGDQWT